MSLIKSKLKGIVSNYTVFRIIIFLILLFTAVNAFIQASPQIKKNENIKIGLLVQTAQHTEAVNGAKLALSIINKKGGIKGRKAELSIRSMEGPWGTGARQSVSLIFDDEVIAVIGSVDGRNSHLVEQACTKTGVLFISCLSADPTLSQAFVPWFFNCVPNDILQAQSLASEIFINNNFSNIAVVKDDQYDSNTSFRFFERSYPDYLKVKKASVRVYNISEATERERTIEEFISGKHDCLILFTSAGNAKAVIKSLKSRKINIPVYSNLYLACEEGKDADELKDAGIKIRFTYPARNNEKYIRFREAYEKEYGRAPGIAAELAYDAVTLLAHVASASGLEREAMQECLYKVYFEGLTGTISFDEMGSRKGPFEIQVF